MRFLHTADWQIGMKAAHVGEQGDAVRKERLAAAQRVVAAANEQRVDFLLVAGDTFENNAVDRVLVQKVGDILAAVAGPVYLISGNHDPLVPGSVWEHPVWRSHSNLLVIRQAEPIDVSGGRLYAGPIKEKYSTSDPTRWIDAASETQICVGVSHGTVEGVAQEELDYPIARNAAERAGVDYLALGHWHSAAWYENSAGAVRMAYSGTHETTKFGERDSGNALLVEIAERGAAPKITKIRTGGLTWRVLEESIAAPGDLARVRQMIETIDNAAKTLLDVRLSGVLCAEDYTELGRMHEIVESRFLFGRLDGSSLLPQPKDDRWLDEAPQGVLREVAERLRELADPAFSQGRPDYASPQVAARAMLELYTLLEEGKH